MAERSGLWLRRCAGVALPTGVFLAAAWLDATPLLRGPAPYPPEWRWGFRGAAPALGLGTALCGVALCGLLAGSGRAASPRRAARGILAAATALGFGLQLGLLGLEAGPSGIAVLLRRTMDPGFTSYYAVAVSPAARDAGALLDRWAEVVPELRRGAHHAATNPPGAVLFYRGVLGLCEAWPALTSRLVGLAGRSGIEVPAELEARAAARLASALASSLLLLLLCAATCWPIAALAGRCGLPPLDAARVGALWVALPGPALMIPELDQALAWLCAGAAALGAAAMARERPLPALAAAAGAGLAAAAALSLSYGSAVFLAFGSALVLASGSDRPGWSHRAARAGAVAAAVALAALALPLLQGYDPVAAWRASLHIHFERYTLRRDYATWLLFNPWDLAVFLGLPLALPAAARGLAALPGLLHLGARPVAVPSRRAAGRVQLACAAALAALLLSGVVRGEAGRTLLPIMPFLLVAATARSDLGAGASGPRGPGARESAGVAALLLASCWVLRLRWELP